MANLQHIPYPIRKIHHVGTSAVLTIDQSHVKRLRIDDFTFFVQKPVENGILLERRVLSDEVGESAIYNETSQR
jgi:hypothetical protein